VEYCEAEGYIRDALDKVAGGGRIRLEPFVRTAEKFAQRIKDGDNLGLAVYSRGADYDIVYHSLNVCTLSLQVAEEYIFSMEQLKRLGAAALLIDIGMIMVPPEIFLKQGRLTPAEMDIVQGHSLVAYNAITGAEDPDTSIAEVVYNIHERCDGSGYPRGIKAKDIPEKAKLLGLVDIYESLTHNRPFRKRLPPLEAIKEVISIGRGGFPLLSFKALINQLTTYPVGCFVKLNSGEIGRVVDKNRFAPLRPKVQVLYTGLGERVDTGCILDLVRQPLLFIVNTIFKEELPDGGV
jgi:HD-GYP domain-containing protein (c-di-GMP phosphodiesterase class II)